MSEYNDTILQFLLNWYFYLEHFESIDGVKAFGAPSTGASTTSPKWWKGWLFSLNGGINLMLIWMKVGASIASSSVTATTRGASITAIFHGAGLWYFSVSYSVCMRWMFYYKV